MFFILKNRKHDVYKKHVLIIYYYFWRVVLKNNYTTCRMIKNKILDIKIIFETYLKILKFSNMTSVLQNSENGFQKLFFRIVLENNCQTNP